METYNATGWLLDRHIEAGSADGVAVRHRHRDVTYGAMQRLVWRVQRALGDLGVGRDQRVVIVMNDSPEMIAWILGCMRSGVVAVPISTMLTGADVASITADAQANALVVSTEYLPVVGAVRAAGGSLRVVHVADDDERPVDADDPDAPAAIERWSAFTDDAEMPPADTTADSAAFWLYSSGTTGSSKGVMHAHGNMQATYDTYARTVLEVTSADRFLSIAKLFFAYGLGNSLTFPFGAGATVILHPDRPTPVAVGDLVAAEKPTLFFAVPGFVAALLDADIDPAAFRSVRAGVTAGEALPGDLQRRCSDRFGFPVLDGIGSTEALHIFLSNRLDRQEPGSSGWVVDGYEATLLDDDDRPVTEPDQPGYLHVRGPSTAAGYWQRPEAAAATFRPDGWLRTGDVYLRSERDTWTFLGRNNDMIKAGGMWVSPAEVEATIVGHPDVLEAAVVGVRNDQGLEETVAFVVARSGHRIDRASIDADCRAHMAAFKRPCQVFAVDELPKTATGKIQRFKLRERLAAPPV